MPSKVTALPVKRGFGQTMRKDSWWVQPLLVFTVFSAFIVYSTWAVLFGYGAHESANLLSPFYSPLVFAPGYHALIESDGPPGFWPSFLIFSPAMLVMWMPVSFRITCYYYRGAYYKAFWADPPNCSVGEPRKGYLGERHLPLLLQNVHRYTLPFAFLLLVFLSKDAWNALWFDSVAGSGAHDQFGVSVGTIVLTINVVLLSLYTFGCHSLRHLVGGGLDLLARRPMRKKAWQCVTWCNKAHMRWAWFSLVWVAFTDVYVRLCATGVWVDWRLF